jgi:predicted Zn-ribbon and HTH transcriptional regulator
MEFANGKKTIRQQLIAFLERHPDTARALAARLGMREREVVDHLPHIEKTLAAGGRCLTVDPAMCSACGFTFAGRRRHSRPSRCPRCRSERIAPPVFAVTDGPAATRSGRESV